MKEVEGAGNAEVASTFEALVRDLEAAAGTKLKDATGTPLADGQDPKFVAERATAFRVDHILVLRHVNTGLRLPGMHQQRRGGLIPPANLNLRFSGISRWIRSLV